MSFILKFRLSLADLWSTVAFCCLVFFTPGCEIGDMQAYVKHWKLLTPLGQQMTMAWYSGAASPLCSHTTDELEHICCCNSFVRLLDMSGPLALHQESHIKSPHPGHFLSHGANFWRCPGSYGDSGSEMRFEIHLFGHPMRCRSCSSLATGLCRPGRAVAERVPLF